MDDLIRFSALNFFMIFEWQSYMHPDENWKVEMGQLVKTFNCIEKGRRISLII